MHTKMPRPMILLFLAVFFGGSIVWGQISLGPDGSNVDALHSLGYTGAGVRVGLLSARNVRPDHQAFYKSVADHNSRVANYDFSGSGVNYTGGKYPGHDTWVAGIIASRGWTGYTTAIGAAPGCELYSARVVTDANQTYISDLIEAFNALINTHNCRVFVIPLQYPGTADANSNLSKLVDYYAYEKNVVLALASGNDYSCPTIFGDAYNGITTGALIDAYAPGIYSQVGTKSNPGPTVDGRNKPDITAPGSSQTTPHIESTAAAYTTAQDGATSFSIPQTAGVAALLLQYADSTSDPCDGRNTVIKAAIVNSTFPNIRNKTGDYTSPATSVWNAQRGYGRIDALAAYEILSAGKINKSVATSAQKGWAHNGLSGNSSDTYLISAEKKERLVLTITWNREVAYYFYAESGPFNINLLIKDPSDANVYTETATLNNLIKVELPLASTGQYKVIIKNMTARARPYAMAFERLETLAGDLNSDFVVNYKDLRQLAADWLNSGTGAVSDIVQDSCNRVNNLDYCRFADDWLDFDSRYYTP